MESGDLEKEEAGREAQAAQGRRRSSEEATPSPYEERTFEAVRTGRSQATSAPLSRVATSRSLSRLRSQNGYSVDDASDSSDEDAAATDPEAAGLREKDPFDVGWDNGDADPMNPRSFHVARKWTIVLIVSFASFCVTCASSIYTSTYEQMDKEFGNSRIVATLGLSTFVVGIALGPMLLGPLSEFYGRRPIYMVSFALFVIWIVPSAVAQNIQTMIIVRFFDGLSGSAFLSVAGGTVGDLFNRNELHLPMTVYSAAPFVGPTMGPLIGGFINSFADWRWTYYVLLIWSGALFLTICLFVPETYHPTLLAKKAKKLRKETGDDRYKAPLEKSNKSLSKALGYSLLRPFQLLIFEPMVLNLCLYSAILLGILYLFFGAFPLVFGGNHGFTLWQVGLTFLGIFVGNVIASCTDPIWHHMRERLIMKREEQTGEQGVSEPEYRLPPTILGAVLVPIGLFWFGWTTYSSVHWIVPILGSAVFGAGTLLAFTGIFTFLVDAYPLYAASAMAANAFVRCLFAAAFPLFGNQMYTKLGYQWATTLLAFLALVMAPFPYLFFIYGKKLRGKSRFATS